MASPPAPVSVVAPIQPAMERARRLLFQPFDFAKWCTIGFCAWLARFGGGGLNGFGAGRRLFPSPAGEVPSSPPALNLHGAYDSWVQVRDAVMRNLYWILPLSVALIGFFVVLWLLMVWLGSRGDFMFLHCVAFDRAEVAVPWRHYASQARSLFLFRVALGLIAVVPLLLLLGTIGVVVWQILGDAIPSAGVLPLIAAGLAVLAVGLGFLVVAKLTTDLVVPIMFLRGSACREAWSELLGLFAGRLQLLIVYLLFQIVLAMAIGAAVFVAVIATCCIAGCLFILPYLGTVALLPIFVFLRAYSVYYLAQLGPGYDLFQPAAPAPPSPA